MELYNQNIIQMKHHKDILYIKTDLEGLAAQSLEGARMGFTGKQCIHPVQVPVVQEAFAPSQERIEWAQQLIEAFSEHQQSGKVGWAEFVCFVCE